jgi:hypothetical protein
MKKTVIASALLALCCTTHIAPAFAATPGFVKQWTFSHAGNPGQTAEIPAFDSRTNTLWVAGVVGVDVLDADTGALVEHIDLTAHGAINSVAIHNGVAAFAIEAIGDRRNPGKVLFYDTRKRQPHRRMGEVAVGALPDMLAFTHDGHKLLVANEGTPNAVADAPYTAPDPVGALSVIDLDTGLVDNLAFADAPLHGSHARTNTGMDFEPEYIAIDHEDERAYVTLQEANAIGVVNLETGVVEEVIGLGVKDFSLVDNGFGGSNAIDPSDRDSRIGLRPVAVKGFYQPDAIAAYRFRGETYLAMANEGDTREDDGDKKRASALGVGGELARLNISSIDSTASDLYTFGGRSFSIRDSAGNLVYDSGNLLDAEAIARGIYDDGRSDDKGVEPEGVEIMEINGRTVAFIGLERTLKSAVAAFDITNPNDVSFLQLLVAEGSVSPEGLKGFRIGNDYYLALSNEVSSTTTVFHLATAAVPEPETYALMLAGLAVVGVAARRRARR